MSLTIGVDPGKHGAVAVVDSYGVLVDVYDMPVVGKYVSARLLADLDDWASGTTFGHVVVEQVRATPQMGVTSSFTFGRSLGVVEGVFAACGLPMSFVTPAKWKADLGLSRDKSASRERAIELWPRHVAKFARVKDDGRAEAALIAYWKVTR